MTLPLPLPLARSAVDRAAERRRDDGWLAESWRSGQVLVVDPKGNAAGTADGLELLPAGRAPAGERYFLGVDGEQAYWAVAVTEPLEGPQVGLWEAGASLGARDAGLFTTARALANWHQTHRHCPRCGTATEVAQAGWIRRCPADGSEHYPRVDPAVIMLVHDGADGVLLGRKAEWPAGRYSILAGFVEPGESLEQAVAREVAEETGVAVHDVTYLASQPWPFPSSLMLGFSAPYAGGEPEIRDAELQDVRWFTRAEIERAAADEDNHDWGVPGDPGGPLQLPPRLAIARRLVEDWLSS
jgi:NAD+ diphosphatase